MAPSDAGRFVREVTNALVALGHRVRQETLIKGTRFDLVFELSAPPADPLAVVVECKFRTSGNVPKDDVSKFAHDVSASGEGIDRAIMVTNQGYTPAGREVASENRIQLLTLEELYDELFSPRKVLQGLVDDYEESDLFGGYVPLIGAFTAAVRNPQAADGGSTTPAAPLPGLIVSDAFGGQPLGAPGTRLVSELWKWERRPQTTFGIPIDLGTYQRPGSTPTRRVETPSRSRQSISDATKAAGSDALALLTELRSVDEPTLAVVLADFGAGKTTLVERFRYTLAKRALTTPEDSGPRIPLLFKLRSRAASASFDAFVLRTAFEQLGVELTVEMFWKQLRAGRFTCLLDGFDEMASRADKHTRHELMRELSPLTEGGGLAVLSCRPSYFVEPGEFNEFIENIRARWQDGIRIHELDTTRSRSHRQKKGASLRAALRATNVDVPHADTTLGRVVLIELAKWSHTEILAFIELNHAALLARKEVTSQEVYDFLSSVYDLRDLVERPILLKMVMETIDHGAIDLDDQSIDIGASQLYEEYTRLKLERDWLKGETRQAVLTPDQRRRVAVQLALQVFETGEQEISIDSVREALASVASSDPEFRRILSDTSEDVVLTDVCTCAFVTRSVGDASFRFVHKSFAEFFVASEIGDDLKRSAGRAGGRGPVTVRTKVDGRIATTRFSPEILYFLGGVAYADNQVRTVLRSLMDLSPGAAPPELRFNVHNSLFSSGPVLRELRIDDVELAALRMRRTSVRKSRIASVIFRASELSDVTFEDSELDFELDRCRLSDVAYRKCRAPIVRHAASEVHGLRMDGDPSLSFDEASTVRDLNLEACRKPSISVTSSTIDGLRLFRAVVELSLLRSQVRRCNCQHSVVLQRSERRPGESATGSLDDSTFEGSAVVLSGSVEITNSRFHACTVLLDGEATFRDCTFRDVVLVTSEDSRDAVFRDCAFAGCTGVGWEPYVTPSRSTDSMERRWFAARRPDGEGARQERRELREWISEVRTRIDVIASAGPAHTRGGGIGRALNEIKALAAQACAEDDPEEADDVDP